MILTLHLRRVLGAALLMAAATAQQIPAAAPASPPASPPAAAARPRLAVLCCVDQLATWVFDQTLPHCGEGGFRRLVREGVSCPRCAYLHGCTETGPGHATLGTGAPASGHGIVKNEWFEPDTKKRVYCVGDAQVAALPEFPEGRGRGPGLLLVPTLGDGIKASFGAAAKVVAVSAKDRSAILMAGRGADAVVWFELATGRWVTNTAWGPTAPKWLLDFDGTKPTDACFGWQWARCAKPEAYADCKDDQPFEMPHQSGGGRTLPVAVRGGKDEPGPAFYGEAFFSPIVDELVLQAVLAALRGEALGSDDVPDLLCISFSANDCVGHMFGPESVEARDTLLRVDGLLAQLLAVLDREVGVGRYLFVLSADHGISPTPEACKQKGLDAGRGLLHSHARAAAEKDLQALFAGANVTGPFVVQASEQALFLDRELVGKAAGAGDHAAAFRRACEVAAAAAARTAAVQCTFVTSELLANGPGEDPIRRAMWYAVHPDRAGDVLLVFKPYWLEGPIPASHGSPFAYDRQVPLLAMGPGLRAGVRCDAEVSPGLAPVLLAHLLGIPRLPAAVDAVPACAIGR